VTPTARVLAMDLKYPTDEDVEYLHFLRNLALKLMIQQYKREKENAG
jgi:hypothetical protein